MPTRDQNATVAKLLSDSCNEVFAGAADATCAPASSHGAPKSERRGEQAPDSITAVLPFSGELEGELVMSAPTEVLQQTYPIPERAQELSLDDLRDWAAECANLLAGRLKRKLGKMDVKIRLATPITLPSSTPRTSAGEGRSDESIHFAFACASGAVEVTAVVESDRPVTFAADEPANPEDVVHEHEVNFF